MPEPNERIGPYQLIRKLGKGGFAQVWLALESTSGKPREVALKIPLAAEIDLDMLLQEATLWARATGHANVLEFLAARVFDGQVVLVSEYAPDGSLEDWLKRQGGKAPSVEAALEMTQGMLAGLEYLHARRIVHRDLKPANILLQGGTPCIAGTRVPVRSIASLYKQGYLPEEIVQQYEHLSIAQVYAALAYYHANRAEVEADMAREEAGYDWSASESERACENA